MARRNIMLEKLEQKRVPLLTIVTPAGKTYRYKGFTDDEIASIITGINYPVEEITWE